MAKKKGLRLKGGCSPQEPRLATNVAKNTTFKLFACNLLTQASPYHGHGFFLFSQPLPLSCTLCRSISSFLSCSWDFPHNDSELFNLEKDQLSSELLMIL